MKMALQPMAKITRLEFTAPSISSSKLKQIFFTLLSTMDGRTVIPSPPQKAQPCGQPLGLWYVILSIFLFLSFIVPSWSFLSSPTKFVPSRRDLVWLSISNYSVFPFLPSLRHSLHRGSLWQPFRSLFTVDYFNEGRLPILGYGVITGLVVLLK